MASPDESEPITVGRVQVRPGPGAIGMNMLITLAVMAMIGFACLSIQNDWIVFAIIVGGGALAAWVILKNFQFAEKFPHAALLNSADLRAWLTREIASKGELPPPNNAKIIENPSFRQVAKPERGEAE